MWIYDLFDLVLYWAYYQCLQKDLQIYANLKLIVQGLNEKRVPLLSKGTRLDENFDHFYYRMSINGLLWTCD